MKIAIPVFLGISLLLSQSSCTKSTSNPTIVYDTIVHSSSGSISVTSSAGFTGRAGAPACVVGGKIYVLCGETNNGVTLNIVECYDPATDTWSSPVTTGTATPRKYSTAAVVNNKIYVIGGHHQDVSLVSELQVFDPQTNAWTTPKTTGTFTPRGSLTSCVVNNKIYVIGGYNGTRSVNTVEVFDPSTNSWSTPPQTNHMTPRHFPASTVFNGKIYVIGGDQDGNVLNLVEVFDPATNTWSTPAINSPMTMTPRFGLVAEALNGYIYTAGGTNGSTYFNTFEVYDPKANTWGIPNVAGSFVNREYLSSCIYSNKLYMIGGYNGEEITTTEVFTPTP